MRVYDEEEAAHLGAKPWQLELLGVNPSYVSWGPHEDYMWKDEGGWDSPQIFPTWAEFGSWQLNELNECASFYFHIERDSEECPDCGGSGYHPSARKIVKTFYRHMCHEVGEPPSAAWCDKITQDEVQALVDAGRLRDFTHEFVAGQGWKPRVPAVAPTAAEVNAWQSGQRLGHDAINRHILTAQRIKRVLGLEDHRCPRCEGHGYTAPEPRLCLTMWWMHPRKGASRGIEVSSLTRDDLPAVQAFLAEAAERNAARFANIGRLREIAGA